MEAESANESQRLAVLQSLQALDTAPEKEFDDVVKIAAAIVGTPMALLSLVDDRRQWFKARLGVGFQETPRDVSFCSHAIRQRNTLIVHDATEDPRFASNPFVTGEPRLRFYAGAPIRVNGAIVGTVCTLDTLPRDISDEQIAALEALAHQTAALFEVRLMNRRLAQSEARFEAFMDYAPMVAYLKDERGCYRYVNRRFADLVHMPREAIEGLPDSRWLPPSVVERYRRQEEVLRRTGQPIEVLESLESPDGVQREWSMLKFPVEVEKSLWIGCVALDVTEQRAASRKIADSERKFRMASEAMHEGALLVDHDNVIQAANPQALRIFGVENTDLRGMKLGDSPWSVLSTDRRPLPFELRPSCLALEGQKVLGQEFIIRQPSGKEVWISMNCEPIFEEGHDRPYSVISTFLDITDEIETRKHLRDSFAQIRAMNDELGSRAEELAEARDAALASAKAKTQFVANMSHEIRTPLNGVIGTTSLLLERPLDEESRKLIAIVRSSGETLLRVIDDILDFSKIDAGKLDIERVPTELQEIVGDVVALYETNAHARGLSLDAKLPETPVPAVMADPVRIKQILGNLVSNAIKFTPRGGVTISLAWETAGEQANVRLAVADTGIGIPPERQGAIFESFTQAEASTHRHFGGTGLGLTICQRLAELMAGGISLESAPGVGSRFEVSLPLDLAPAESMDKPGETPGELPRGLRVLLAEDNEINTIVARAILENLGCEVTAVADGIGAIAAATSEPFDLVLMDMHMPVCDGLEAARTIRRQEKEGRLPILALTASALQEDREACREAGMDGFVTKPFTASDIARAIRQWAPSRPA